MKRQHTFEEVALQWQQYKKGRIKDTSWLRYDLMLHNMLLPVFGGLTHIDEKTVQKYVQDNHIREYALMTIKAAVALLKEIVTYADKQNIMKYTPWDIVYPRDYKPKKVPVLSKSDHRKLLSYLSENIAPQYMAIMLSLCTGMRIGECCALRWDDVDMTNRTLSVSATRIRVYDRQKGKTEIFTNTPKTVNAYREIPIPPKLYSALRAVRKIQHQHEYVCGDINAADPRNVRGTYERLLKRLGIPFIKFHGLRHTFATRCIEAGVDVKTVSAILGHSNVATTMNLYVHPTIDNKRDAMKRLAKKLNM